jgi:threonyl-tRNA synthetase
MFFLPQFQRELLLPHSSLPATGKEILQALDLEQGSFVAIQVDGILQDLSAFLPETAELYLIACNSPEGLTVLRHSAAHVLAQAVKELYPETQVTIGPVIEDGFYYDFSPVSPFQEKDLPLIEARMRDIVKRNDPLMREVWSREKVVAYFEAQKEHFKVEVIGAIPPEESISIYRQGAFLDVCRGPHLPSTGLLGKGFALTKLSGAYWRGDANGPQLQRIYGTAWANEDDLKAYLFRMQELEKRDHRRLGKEMDLFHSQEEAPGAIFWHPSGWIVYQILQDFIREELKDQAYQEVNTPQLISKTLWEASGHWEKFRDHIFCVSVEDETMDEENALDHAKIYGMKPMSCPCHIQIFKQKLHSYRDLPLRMSEFGRVMRHESSGSRLGLMRLFSFVQDDGHIFCTPDQTLEETARFCRHLMSIYRTLGFNEVIVRFSTRPTMRLGSDEVWDQAEAALEKGAKAAGLTLELFPGEGAFYGPKLEFVLKDSLGRLWQCGTLQMDFVMPKRLGAVYIDAAGEKQSPILLHRALLGSMERFMGVLLEHTGGHLPFWLAPVQGVILTVSEKALEYGKEVLECMKGFRIHLDDRNEKLGYKIREHTLKKVPCLLIVGTEEAQNRTVMLRSYAPGESLQERFSLEELRQALEKNTTPFK